MANKSLFGLLVDLDRGLGLHFVLGLLLGFVLGIPRFPVNDQVSSDLSI